MSKLDQYEQDIESNFEKQKSIKTSNEMQKFQGFASSHLKRKKSITIRVGVNIFS